MSKANCSHQPFEKTNGDSSTYDKSTTPLEYNICLEDSIEPVVTQCGHVYCWRCIYQWLEPKGQNSYCPVCSAAITIEKLVPIYSKNERVRIPERLKPKREERKRSNEIAADNNRIGGFFNRVHTWGHSSDNFSIPSTSVNSRNAPLLIAIIPTLIFIVYPWMMGRAGGSIYNMSSSPSDSIYLGLLGVFLYLGIILLKKITTRQ